MRTVAQNAALAATRAASCASTASPGRVPVCSPTTSRWSGSFPPWTVYSRARLRTDGASSTASSAASTRSYRALLGQFERAMQQRNRLLADDVRDGARFEAFERIMAETGVAIAAARAVAVAELAAAIGARRDAGAGALFPWAELALVGTLESALAARPAIEVEDDYFALLGRERERDRAAGRTLDGPHRSDLAVGHGPKELPAKVCSTGEQKALLIGLVLAHCDVVGQRQEGAAPILILDEITAHLDPLRRAALFEEVVALGSQTWMSGTDPEAFAALGERAQFFRVEEGRITPFR